MIKILDSTKKNFDIKFKKLILDRRKIDSKVLKSVNKIINHVKKKGDNALVYYEKKFNNNSIIIPSKKKINSAIRNLEPSVKKAIFESYKRIKKWHSFQIKKDIYFKDKLGNKFSYKSIPISSVGVYCPGNLPSSALMNCVPAKLAGVKRIVLCTPSLNGNLNGAVLYAAKLCKVNEIISISGASAVAALACGTKKVRPVDKCVGPGSQYVATAKKILSLNNQISMERSYFGPSEIVCWSDNSSSPEEIATSIIAQSEHDLKSQSIMFSKDMKLIIKVKKMIQILLKDLPRKKISYQSLSKYGALIYAKKNKDILKYINFIAPEHVELTIKNYKKYLNNKLINVGSIAAGPYSSMALSDYGPTQHSLPTNGTARFSGGLNVSEFTKQISINELSKKGLKKLSKSGYVLSKFEKLMGHSLSIKIKTLRRK